MSTPGQQRAAVFERELTFYGARPLVDRPKHVIGGAFLFVGVITDNATTMANLRAIAAFKDGMLLDRYSDDNPQMILQVDAVELYLENNGLVDTGALISDVMQELELYHKHDEKERTIGCFPFVGTTFDRVATTANNTTVYGREGKLHELDRPLEVDFQTDPFGLRPRTAVNVGADIPFQLVLHGYSWPNEFGRREARDVGRIAKLDDVRDLREVRAQAASRRSRFFVRSGR